jgi:hypothetical protein
MHAFAQPESTCTWSTRVPPNELVSVVRLCCLEYVFTATAVAVYALRFIATWRNRLSTQHVRAGFVHSAIDKHGQCRSRPTSKVEYCWQQRDCKASVDTWVSYKYVPLRIQFKQPKDFAVYAKYPCMRTRHTWSNQQLVAFSIGKLSRKRT